jgi:hypothetical protein
MLNGAANKLSLTPPLSEAKVQYLLFRNGILQQLYFGAISFIVGKEANFTCGERRSFRLIKMCPRHPFGEIIQAVGLYRDTGPLWGRKHRDIGVMLGSGSRTRAVDQKRSFSVRLII